MSFLSGNIKRAVSGTKGFDTTARLDSNLATKFKTDGYEFCVRYLSRLSTDSEVANGDLIRDEAEVILEAGLGLMAAQHVMAGEWVPTPALGTAYGNHAANNAVFAGLPSGVCIWLDLESVDVKKTPVHDVIAYCNNWFNQVAAVGYVPGIYIGFDSILTSDQLFHSLTCEHYWKSPSKVPDVAVRGYQMLQPKVDKNVNGINIDVDTVQTDHLGGLPFYLVR